jgi:hypothetical protein
MLLLRGPGGRFGDQHGDEGASSVPQSITRTYETFGNGLKFTQVKRLRIPAGVPQCGNDG